MGAQSKIEWTDASWNPIRARRRGTTKLGWFCVHASEGCRHCYAETMNHRLGTGIGFKAQNRNAVEILLDDKMLTAPLRWKQPRRIFVCSMTDLFADFVPDDFIDRMFAVMALCPQHIFQILTKRPERMQGYMAGCEQRIVTQMLALAGDGFHYKEICPRGILGQGITGISPWPLPNVWLGTSVEDQNTADARIPYLLKTTAAIRFLSCEPLLGPIDLTNIDLGHADGTHLWLDALTGLHSDGTDAITGVINQPDPHIDWVICGGESGPGARPMHPDWARALRDQCTAANVPFFFKQWGRYTPAFTHPSKFVRAGEIHEFDGLICAGRGGKQTCIVMSPMSKAHAGRLLDGIEHNAMPQVQA